MTIAELVTACQDAQAARTAATDALSTWLAQEQALRVAVDSTTATQAAAEQALLDAVRAGE
jgi:hypothetical protein